MGIDQGQKRLFFFGVLAPIVPLHSHQFIYNTDRIQKLLQPAQRLRHQTKRLRRRLCRISPAGGATYSACPTTFREGELEHVWKRTNRRKRMRCILDGTHITVSSQIDDTGTTTALRKATEFFPL